MFCYYFRFRFLISNIVPKDGIDANNVLIMLYKHLFLSEPSD